MTKLSIWSSISLNQVRLIIKETLHMCGQETDCAENLSSNFVYYTKIRHCKGMKGNCNNYMPYMISTLKCRFQGIGLGRAIGHPYYLNLSHLHLYLQKLAFSLFVDLELHLNPYPGMKVPDIFVPKTDISDTNIQFYSKGLFNFDTTSYQYSSYFYSALHERKRDYYSKFLCQSGRSQHFVPNAEIQNFTN